MKIKTLCFINTSIKIEMAYNKFSPHFKNSDLLPKKFSFSKKKNKINRNQGLFKYSDLLPKKYSFSKKIKKNKQKSRTEIKKQNACSIKHGLLTLSH